MRPFTADSSRRIFGTGEPELLRRIVEALGGAAPAWPEGPGDDCAVLEPQPLPGRRLVTTDAVIHGRHFDDALAPEDAGRKLVRRNLSDIAAMGGVPSDAVLSVMMGPDVDADWFFRFIAGVGEVCREYSVKLVGGDLAKLPAGLFVASMALTGFAERPIPRLGAQSGDFIYVTGRLGGSIAGHHHAFTPRLREGAFFAEHAGVRAAMDLTDGPAKDLPSMLPARTVALLDTAALPVSEACRAAAQASGRSVTAHALSDGEDYELILAVVPESAESLESAFAAAFPEVPFTRIGRIVPAAGLTAGSLYDESGCAIDSAGFDHFG